MFDEVMNVTGKFIIMKIKKNGYTFKLKAGNGEIIAVSDLYSNVDSCKIGVEKVKKYSLSHIEDQTVKNYDVMVCPKYEVYREKDGLFRFRLVDEQGFSIATGEGYTAKASCLNGITSIGRNAPGAVVIAEE